MDWAGRIEWSDQQAAVFDAHLIPVCEHIGISPEELTQELAMHGFESMLFGIVFEDFVSRRLPPDGRNIIDDYLQRRGWRESIPGRRYLQQLRDSVLSLYEVVEISPGHHCDLRDLVRAGEPFRVHERMGTQSLVKWDRIAARVMVMNDQRVFSGGILPFPAESAQDLIKVLSKAKKRARKELSQVADENGLPKTWLLADLEELFLRDACTDFTRIWLIHILEGLRKPLPKLVNRDGDSLLFTKTRFSFPAAQTEEITQRLDDAPDWERKKTNDQSWLWLPGPAVTANKPGPDIAIETFQNGQQLISGSLEMKPGVLMLTSNSRERMERAQAALGLLLHGLIGPALSMLQTPEQLLAENAANRQGDGQQESTDNIDPEIAAEIVHNMLDQHYRQCLDDPIPALDNKTPRQSMSTKKGREKVVEWLKHLENSELRRAASQGQIPYDSGWMWDELKLEKE